MLRLENAGIHINKHEGGGGEFADVKIPREYPVKALHTNMALKTPIN